MIKTTKNDIAFVWEINLSIYYAPNVDDVKGNLIIELYHDMGHLVVPFDLNISVNNDGDYVSTHTLTLDQVNVNNCPKSLEPVFLFSETEELNKQCLRNRLLPR